jgi:hypothetical protein
METFDFCQTIKPFYISMKRCIFYLSVLSLTTFLASCQKEEEQPAPLPTLAVHTTQNLPADATTPYTGKFTLYSLKDKAVVANADSATNAWDIGFRGTTIIVNGGAIRTGQGGAYIHTGLFEELKEISATQVFNTDESATQLAIPTGSNNGWYNYNPANNWISPLAGKILVIRTGDGKYAKVEILSYYQDSPTTPSPTAKARYYSFRYVYQPDGSRTF